MRSNDLDRNSLGARGLLVSGPVVAQKLESGLVAEKVLGHFQSTALCSKARYTQMVRAPVQRTLLTSVCIANCIFISTK